MSIVVKIFIKFLILMASLPVVSQNTAIPDNSFEQALINLGIDSDGIINGQVLTSDIQNITNLNLSGIPIQDLTGLEDFAALIKLNISETEISHLDLSGNLLLEELYCNASATDATALLIEIIDLSNNPNIQIVEVRNLPILFTINMKNGNNANMTSIVFDLYFEGWPGDNNNKPMCIQVDDETAAQQNQYPYSTWVIDDYQVLILFRKTAVWD